MKAYITSTGESTTDLSKWSLERLDFEVLVLNDQSTLWEKLDWIYKTADDDFIRVDGDVVCNKQVLKLAKQKKLWWYQAFTFDWFKQDITHGGIQLVRKQCFKAIREHIKEAEHEERPETYLSRLKEFHNPRVFGTFEQICGIHGYAQFQEDNDRTYRNKIRRQQLDNYDFELAERLNAL